MFLNWTKTDFKQRKNLKFQNTFLRPIKWSMIIEAIQINFFFDLAPNFYFFSAVAYSAKTKIPGNKG